MFRKTCPCVAALVLFLALPGAAQQTQTIGREEAEKSLVHKVEAVYPPAALADHISGTVVLRVTIGADGKVVSTTIVSGPPVFHQASTDAVSQWEYTPFVVNGKAVSAVAEVRINFSLPDPGPQDYPSLAAGCHSSMASGDSDLQVTLDLCNKSAAEADKFAPDGHFIERRSAYVFDAAALLRARRYAEAEVVARKGVAVVKQGHDDDSGRSAAYAVLGNAEAMLGNLDAAAVDIQAAENYQRTAVESPAGKTSAAESRQTLKTILLFHADLLDRMQRPMEAKARRDEAAAL